jgi:hypothetical protein
MLQRQLMQVFIINNYLIPITYRIKSNSDNAGARARVNQ